MDEQSIFLEALKKTDSAEVSAWLDASCGEDMQLRIRVEALLRRHHDASGFLEEPVDALELTCVAAAGADIASGHASVLRSIGKRLGEFKGVTLQDGEEEMEDPVVQVSSPQVPRSDVDSRYQFLGEIARGGMGAVIKGRDTDLGRDLAVKVLLDDHKDKPEVVQRFVEETQIGGQLQHPGIAPVYELGQFADQRPFFTMKLVKGKTLATLLSQRDSPDQDQTKLLGIFEQVCQTMAYAHSRNVIHRDLKPANIMVGAFGEVQVMDWGLAKVLQTGGVAAEQITNYLESAARRLKQAEVRRKLTYVVAASLILLVTGLGAGGVWLQARETELQVQKTEAANQVAAAERKRAEDQEKNNEELQLALYASEIQLASAEIGAGNLQNVIDMLDSHIPKPGASDRRGFEWHYLNRLCLRPRVVGHVDWRGQTPGWQRYTDDWKRKVEQSVVGQDDRESRRRIAVTDVETNTEVWSTEVTRPIAYDPRHTACITVTCRRHAKDGFGS